MSEYRLIPEFVSLQEEMNIMDQIQTLGDSKMKRTDTERSKLLRFGRFKPTLKDLSPNIPSFLAELSDRITASGHLPEPPDAIQVNEYLPGQGIEPHIDSLSNGEIITSLSLGSHTVLEFARAGETFSVVIPARTLFQIWGKLRYEWTHAIIPKNYDLIEGERMPRTRRYSLIFRKSCWATER